MMHQASMGIGLRISYRMPHYPPGAYEFAKGDFIVRDGRIAGLDRGGCTFVGTAIVERLPDGWMAHVNVIIDPRTGIPGAVMFFDDGIPRREPIQRTLVLKIRDVNGTLLLTGTGPFGPGAITVNARRKARLGNADA